MENIKQNLIELMADFLDSELIKDKECFLGLKDPIERHKSELHIRMAELAFNEYKKTVIKNDNRTHGKTKRVFKKTAK